MLTLILNTIFLIKMETKSNNIEKNPFPTERGFFVSFFYPLCLRGRIGNICMYRVNLSQNIVA
jgi:hypothetical protein